jgi:WD40 repeat protein
VLLALACLSPSAAPPPPCDAFGDPLPLGAVARMGTTRLRVVLPEAIAFSPDGKSVVSARFERAGEEAARFDFWDVRTGRRVRSVEVPTTEATGGLEISRDGKTLVAVDYEGDGWVVRLFDARTGKPGGRLRGRGTKCVLLALSPDGKTALIDDGPLSVWDVGTASVKYRLDDVHTRRGLVTFLPDGKAFVARRTDGKLYLIRTADGKNIRDLEPDVDRNSPGKRLACLAVTPDGKHLVYRLHDERAVRVVELATGKEARKWDDDDKPSSSDTLAVTSDGRTLVASSKDGARIWDLAAGKRLREIACGFAYRFGLSPDGKTVALATLAAIRLHDVATGKALHDAGHWDLVEELAFSADGKRLASHAMDSVRIWDASTGKELSRFEPPSGLYLRHLRWEGGSVRWVASDNALYRWKPGEREAAKRTDPRPLVRDFYAKVCPNGEWLATEDGGRVRLRSLLDQKRDRLLFDPPSKVERGITKTFSSDGRLLAIVPSELQTVIVFDVASGERVLEMPLRAGISHKIDFAPDGRSLLLHDGRWREGRSQVYEVATGRLRLELPDSDTCPDVVAWTPDGRLVACGDGNGSLVVYDAHSGKGLWKGKRSTTSVPGPIALSPDGRRLAADDGTSILVYPLPTPVKVKSPLTDEKAWQALTDADAVAGFAAILHFVSEPDAAVKWFAAKLSLPAERDKKQIAKLVEQLGDDDFDGRQKASAELAKIGPAARGELRAALKSDSPEVRRRAAVLLEKLTTTSPERLRILRAIEALERIGTPAAEGVLKGLIAGKVVADLKADVEAALARVRSRRGQAR